ncbi:MAG: zinc ABC transporter substrate-binding protein [Clostridia bacterium]|nr:zinc ABC transporter substrate-binding protein [Clostridia bacterium]
MRKLRAIAGILCMVLLLGMLAGCEKAPVKPQTEEKSALSVYATFYPFYALASMIGEGVPDLQVNCLVQPQDGCLRAYQLSDWDLALLTGAADAVIAGGRGLESFESILYALGDEGPAIASVLYNMDLSSYSPAETAEESHWSGENPHIYLKIDGAIEIAERIAANFAVIDPEYGDLYAENLEKAKNRLESLKTEVHSDDQTLVGNPVAVINEALVYVAEEFELEIALCIERESGEDFYESDLEACLVALSESSAKVVLIEKQAPQRFCEALEAAGYAVAKLDTLSTRRAGEGSEGYFEAQRANAAAIKAAFAAEMEADS